MIRADAPEFSVEALLSDSPLAEDGADRQGTEFTPAIFTLDAEGCFTRVGLRLARLLGMRRQELVGTPIIGFLDPAERAEFSDRWCDLRAGGEALELETTLLLRDGGLRARLDLLVQDDEANAYAGVLSPASGPWRRSESDSGFPKTLLDTFGTMVMIADAQGLPIYSNDALRRRFGRPLGGSGFALVHPDDREKALAAWDQSISAKVAFAYQMRMAAPGEPHRWICFDARPHYDDRGNIRFWAATLRDIEEEIASRDALTDARRFIARFGKASPDVMYLYDLEEERIIYCSEGSTRMLGYLPSAVQALGSSLLVTIVHPEDWPQVAAEMIQGAAQEDPPDENHTAEFRIVRKDGVTIWVSTRSLVFERTAEGRPKVTLGIIQEITERKSAESDRDDHTRILEHALSGVAVLDRDGRYTYANSEYAELAGRTPSDLIGRSWVEAVHDDDVAKMRAVYGEMIGTGRVEAECRGVRPDGEILHKHVVMIPKLQGGTFAGHYCFVRDVTERAQFQGQLETQLAHISSMSAELEQRSNELQCANAILAKQAGSDGLTALANHRVLQETLQSLNEAGQPHSLLLLDVDHFKAFNDAFGHPAGDLVLQDFARVLEGMTADGELAARYGGEEFAVVLPDVDLEGAEVRAELILNRLAEVDWPYRPITASVGCTVWTSGRSRADLIEIADRALYVSKRNGRNRVTAAA